MKTFLTDANFLFSLPVSKENMKNKEKYYWKIINTKNGKYTSYIITKGKYEVTYKVGKYVSAPIKKNGLFLFRTRKLARQFAEFGGMIFKVRVRVKQILNPTIYSITDLENNQLRKNYLVPLYGSCNFPEVMLVEKAR